MNWTPQQEAAIRAQGRRVCVDAGAGSGKTRVLVDRIVHLIEDREVPLEEIVAITFTENAASEMKARLRAAFRKKAPQDDPKGLSRWRERERRIDGARISTIHTFCSTLLRAHALQIGRDPDFVVLADADAALLLSETVDAVLEELMEAGDPALLGAVEERSLPELAGMIEDMLAKRSVIERLGRDCALDDPNALLRRWKEVLRRERDRRLDALRRMPQVRRLITQLKSFEGNCTSAEDGREKRRRAYLEGLRAIAAASCAAETERALNAIVSFDGGRGAKKNWPSDEVYARLEKVQKDVAAFAEEFLPGPGDETIEEEAARRTAGLCRIYARAAQSHEAAKAAVNGLDFDDLILHALRMLQENEPLRNRIASEIRHLLIDEFQDTDHVQMEIARLLHEAPAGPDLFIVGDAKQSIYLFRGAEVEVFNGQRGVSDKILPLDRNFRTVPDLLEAVNAFFDATRLLDTVQDYAPMAAVRPARRAPCLEFLMPELHDDASVEDYRSLEAELIAARIQEMCDGEARVEIERGGVDVPASYGDVAILLRAMSNVFLYEEPLRRAGIPYMVVAGAGFYERQEVLDVLNLLQVLVDPWNEPALFGFLRSPMAGLNDESLLRLARSGGLAAAFQSSAEPEGLTQPDAWRRARALFEEFRGMLLRPLPELLRHVLDRTGYEAILLGQYLGLQKASNVRKLVDLADSFTRTRPATVRSFITYLNEVRGQAVREGEAPMQPEGAGAVTIMTVHKAKGLEFPVVFVPDISLVPRGSNRTTVPLHRSLGLAVKVTNGSGERVASSMGEAIRRRCAEEETAEHARVLYVAMTRARDYLVLSGAPMPKKGSWLESIDAHFGITERPDGATVTGEGWSARVCRSVARRRTKTAKGKEIPLPPLEAVERMTAPLEHLASARRVFSVSVLLDAMLDTPNPDTAQRETLRGAGAASPARLSALVRGSLVHRMFEFWDFASEPDIEPLLAEAGIPRTLRRAAVVDLRSVAERFLALPLTEQLRRDAGIQRETPFSLRVGDALVTGKVDVLLGDGTIVDYKTGAVHETLQARYEWQLLLYALAARRLCGLTPERGVLCYVDSGEVREMATTPDRMEQAECRAAEAIERLRRAAPSFHDLAEFTGDA